MWLWEAGASAANKPFPVHLAAFSLHPPSPPPHSASFLFCLLPDSLLLLLFILLSPSPRDQPVTSCGESGLRGPTSASPAHPSPHQLAHNQGPSRRSLRGEDSRHALCPLGTSEGQFHLLSQHIVSGCEPLAPGSSGFSAPD